MYYQARQWAALNFPPRRRSLNTARQSRGFVLASSVSRLQAEPQRARWERRYLGFHKGYVVGGWSAIITPLYPTPLLRLPAWPLVNRQIKKARIAPGLCLFVLARDGRMCLGRLRCIVSAFR